MGFKHLNVEKPCSQPLENMDTLAEGKFCRSCKHIVYDFSNMSTHELVKMLQSKKYSCGVFDKQQLGTLYYEEDPRKTTRKKYWNGIAAAIVAGTLQLSSAYSQNPVRTHKLYPRSMAFEKYQGEKQTIVTEQENNSVKKEKFDFMVLDEETRAPLPYTKVVIMGISGLTDEHGKISYDLEYSADTTIRFVAELSLYRYEDEHVKLKLQTCYQKMTVMYMRRNKQKIQRELVQGFF